MIDPKIFYSAFLVNYFDYKSTYLKFALKNYKEFQLEKSILQYSDREFLLSIKSDIRQTLYQAIETVFEILFALTPNKDGYTADKEILKALSKGESRYRQIGQIAVNKNELNFLDNDILLNDQKKVSILQYIFFFGLHNLDDIQEKIKTSLEAVKEGLFILAQEFSDRSEYNCYKHGLRIIPALDLFKIMSVENNDKKVTWDLTNSMTYYQEDEKDNKMEFITKLFDTERDFNLIRLCSDFLWNMIKIRDLAFNKLPKSNSETASIEIIFFDKNLIKVANKGHVPIQNLRFSTSIKEK